MPDGIPVRDNGPTMRRTILALHAHPDDEALLTGGTLAQATEAGHRVVIVTATDGSLGLTSRSFNRETLGQVRLGELRESAAGLGAERVHWLGYADSGMSPVLPADPDGLQRFVRAPVPEAAERVAALLREESADLLISYDRNGGYGHPDHRRVHEVGALAAQLAGTPRVLEARVSDRVAAIMKPRQVVFEALEPVTHVIDVRPWLEIKRTAMRAHRSQLAADGPVPRNIELLTRLPGALLSRAIGTERFCDPTLPPGSPVTSRLWD